MVQNLNNRKSLYFYPLSLIIAALLVLAGCTMVQPPTGTPEATAGSPEMAAGEEAAMPSAQPSPSEPPERVLIPSETSTLEISSLMPSGPGIQEYIVAARSGATMTVDVTSDGAPLSLTIKSPSGNQRIPEMREVDGAYAIGHQFVAEEDGDYLVTLGKGDHSPSTNYTATFTVILPPPPQGVQVPSTTGEAQANGITIAYESFGAEGSETILLIAGTGMQLTGWPMELIAQLVERGYRVVRFDNRDMGLSTKHSEAGLPDGDAIAAAIEAGEAIPMPYLLPDMADDAVGLLDALGIEQAHLVGLSMGGAIAQLIAIDYPERTLSLTSIAADSGNPELPALAKPEAFEGVPPLPTTVDRDLFVEWQVKTWQALAGSIFVPDETTLHQHAVRDFERNFDPEAMVRQQTVSLLGHLDSASYRFNNLETITAPAVVVQGTEDPIVPVESAEDIAAAIPNAELRVISGLGHYLPVEVVPVIADAVITAATKTS